LPNAVQLSREKYGDQTHRTFSNSARAIQEDRAEDIVYVSPGGDVLGGRVAVDAGRPRVPLAVHLVGEAQVEGLPPCGGVPRPPCDVCVVLPGDDLPKRVVGLVALPSGYRGVQVTIGIAPCDTTSSIIHTPLSPSKLK
jgi:hypothetical protein